ncbi:MAG: AAA family ATPase [Phycisphaerales bacterium]|nr:AAA family ATPase [Phycisphaerales bacterium]
MDLDFFGLKRDPFADALDSDLYCPTQVHEEATAALKRWVGSTPGAVLLVGDAGCGKTVLARRLCAEHGEADRRLELTCSRAAGSQILTGLCQKFGIQPAAGGGGLRTLSRIRNYLRNKVRTKGRFLVVVDQAQDMDAETAEQLAALVREDGGGERGCQILLVGRSGAQTLLQNEGRALRRQVRSLIQLPPMSLRDTTVYIAHRLAAAGAGAEIFDAQASARIHALAGGNARRVNQICAHALEAARSAELQRVTIAHTAEAARRAALAVAAATDTPPAPSERLPGGARPMRDAPVTREIITTPITEPNRGAVLAESTIDRDGLETSLLASACAGPASAAARPVGLEPSIDERFSPGAPSAPTDDFNKLGFAPPTAPTAMTAAAPTPGAGIEVQHAMDSLIANGEALLARLEESLDRTDVRGEAEMGPTFDPSGTESRLEHALVRGERLLQKLSGAAERITRAVETSEARATQAANVYQNTARLMMARVENAQSVSRQLTTQIERLETVSREAREAEWRLQQTRTQQNEWTHQTDELAARLEHTRVAAERTGAELARSLRGGQELADSLTTAVQQGQTLVRDLPERLSKTDETLSALTRQTRAVEQLQDTFQKSTTGWKTTLQSAVASAERASEQLKGRVDHAGAALSQTETSLARIGEHAARIDELKSIEEQAARRCTELQECTDDLRQRLETSTHRAERATAAIAEATEEARQAQTRLAETGDKLQSCEQQVVDRMLALGAACERADASQLAAEQLGDLLAHAQRAHERGETSLRQLKELLTRADRLSEFFREDDSAGGRSRAAVLIEKLTLARDRAAEAQAELATQTRENEARAEAARTQVGSLLDRVAAQLQKHGDIDAVLADAQQITDRLRTEVVAAQDRLAALASHIAAASSVMNELSEQHQHTRADLKDARQSEQHLVEVRGQMEALVKDLWEIGASAQAQGDRLAERQGEIEPLVTQLETLVTQTKTQTAALTEENAAARQQTDALRATGAGAGKLVEKLAGITQSLQSAKVLRDAMTVLVTQAGAAHEALAKTQSDVQSCLDQLRGTHDQALVTLGEQRQLHDQSVTSAERLESACRQARQTSVEVAEAEAKCHETLSRAHEAVERAQLVASAADDLLRQLSDKEGTIEVGDRMLREFITQAHGLAERLKEVHARTGQIERQIADLSTEPQKVVVEARQQADQLDKVCKAVQKVFAGLSKVSLDATKRIEEFRKTSQETDSRLERLATETEQAACTLKEWVEEAIRAQSRLAATLAKSPSVLLTHPQQTLQAMSGVLDSSGTPSLASRLPRPPRRDVDDRTTKAEPTTAAAENIVRPRTKAQVINDLVRDAQRIVQEPAKA